MTRSTRKITTHQPRPRLRPLALGYPDSAPIVWANNRNALPEPARWLADGRVELWGTIYASLTAAARAMAEHLGQRLPQSFQEALYWDLPTNSLMAGERGYAMHSSRCRGRSSLVSWARIYRFWARMTLADARRAGVPSRQRRIWVAESHNTVGLAPTMVDWDVAISPDYTMTVPMHSAPNRCGGGSRSLFLENHGYMLWLEATQESEDDDKAGYEDGPLLDDRWWSEFAYATDVDPNAENADEDDRKGNCSRLRLIDHVAAVRAFWTGPGARAFR
jgi:hypothetical protein